MPYHGRGLATDVSAASGHFGDDIDATTDISNFRGPSGDRDRKLSAERMDYEMRSQLLDEKEKRRTIQETLTKTKEEKYWPFKKFTAKEIDENKEKAFTH